MYDDVNDKAVQVEYVEIDKITYYTAVQVAEEIEEPVSTVRSWAGKDFGDLLEIDKVNGRKCFVKEDIKRLKFIKGLRKANMSINQIKDYIDKHGFKYAEYNSGLVDTKDPLGFQALASALSVEVDNKLNLFMNRLIKEMAESNSKQLTSVVEELNETLMDTLDEKMNVYNLENKKQLEEIAITVDDVMSDKFESLENEVKYLREDFKSAYVSKEEIEKKSNGNILSRIRKFWNQEI